MRKLGGCGRGPVGLNVCLDSLLQLSLGTKTDSELYTRWKLVEQVLQKKEEVGSSPTRTSFFDFCYAWI